MNKEGDWLCPACQHLNFKKRDPCQRCSCPKNATAADVSLIPRTDLMMPGDWYCGGLNCGAHNFASRTSCYRCGLLKDAGYAYETIPGWKPGDWICTRLGCDMHNYASRKECYKCKIPRICEEQS